jgi:P27 family predicted phage terminase small subunit
MGGKGSGGHNKATLRDRQIKGVRPCRMPKAPVEVLPVRFAEIETLGEKGREYFAKHYDMLILNGTMSETDAGMFNALCSAWENWFIMSAIAKKAKAKIYKGVDPEPGEVIALNKENDYLRIFQSLAREFGLSPQARSSVDRVVAQSKPKFFGITK